MNWTISAIQQAVNRHIGRKGYFVIHSPLLVEIGSISPIVINGQGRNGQERKQKFYPAVKIVGISTYEEYSAQFERDTAFAETEAYYYKAIMD